MKKLIVFNFILCMFFYVCSAFADVTEGKPTVNVGFFEIKPHSFLSEQTNEATGASVDYLFDVAEQLGYELNWKGPYPFPRLVEMLKESTIDCAIVFTRNNEREKILNYPNQPYYHVRPIVAVVADSSLKKVDSIDDIQGFKVGYLAGANQSPIIKNNHDKISLELLSGKNWVEQNIKKLVNGRLDAVYDLNQNTVVYSATLMGLQDKIRIITLPEKEMPLYVVFSRSSETSRMFFDDYNKYIEDNDTNYSKYINNIIAGLST